MDVDVVVADIGGRKRAQRERGRRTRTYVAALSPDDRKRYSHTRVGGRLVAFVLQYETRIAGDWYPVVRYDCAHGAAHKDLLDIRGRQEKHLLSTEDLSEALALADSDIRGDWRRYKERFTRRR